MENQTQALLQVSPDQPPKQAMILVGGGVALAIVVWIAGHYLSRFLNKHVDPHVEKKAGEMVDRLRGRKDDVKKEIQED